ncbi:MAG TPA: HNH endonuclease signature motif containing protein, partial [Microterricola sp.]
TEQKNTPTGSPGWRSRDQIRTDLAVAWLAGDGTPTAAKVRPVLLIPMLSLLGEGDEPIELRGYGTIDRASAARLLAQAPSFRRVATDPFTSEKIDYDRTRYRPTKAQRDWIQMRFESCIDPNCSRPAADSDVDHLQEWVRDNGPSNAENLFPLCERGNRRKNLSRFDYSRLPDGRVTIHTPTGLDITTDDPPF